MALTDFLPALGDVGDQLHVRTRDSNGVEQGTFTAATSPTDTAVTNLIAKAASQVTAKIGDNLPEALWEAAKTVIALRAAMMVELSYFGDQVAANRSPYAELKTLHDEAWAELYYDWENIGVDGEPGTADDAAGMPVFSFPDQACRAAGAEFPACSPYGPDSWYWRGGCW